MRFPFFRLQVVGNSMIPTLKPGQVIVSFNWFYQPKVGDLVVIDVKKKLVKRIKQIKKGKIYLIGDNITQSTDSRDFGWIDQNQIIGNVIYIYSS